ncbi:MAG: M48 family metalloprotease [candidate division WOR-3 bacterium]|nr:MAG: M48 family metalloprotease [candidate division WOR-3 bacterium]
MAERENLYKLISRNKWGTGLFVLLFTLILAVIGMGLGLWFGWDWWVYALFGIGIVLYNLVLYFNSSRIALAVNGARPAGTEEFKQLHNVVEEVAIAAGLPKPGVYVIETEAPNAFATGRDPEHASIAVTRGLVEMMSRDELQGVVAHELAHIRNYDILMMTVVAIIGGIIILFRDVFLRWGLFFGGGRRRRSSAGRGGGGQVQLILMIVGLVLAILAPLLVALIRSAISRQREYLADASGAYIVRNPNGLASALSKLAGTRQKLRSASNATAHMFITNPFAKDRDISSSWFSSHPPLADRIDRLRVLTMEGRDEAVDGRR